MRPSSPLPFILLGIIFWFSAALLVRFIGPYALTPGNPLRLVLFVVAGPITIGFLASAKRVGRMGWHQLLRPTVIMTYTATLLDGVALTWFHTLYSTSYEVALSGAALILWGAGLGLLLALLLEQRQALSQTGAAGQFAEEPADLHSARH